MMKKIIPFVLICFIIPFSLNFIMYYGAVSTSPAKIYTVGEFEEHFGDDVLKHRILGRYFLLKINEVVSGIEIPFKVNVFDRISVFIEAESLSLYHSFFILNTIFLCLTIVVLYILFNQEWVSIYVTNKQIYLLLISSLIAISQFTIVPYDTLSYFFISLVILLMMRGNSTNNILLIGLLILIGTTARETIALTLSFYLLLIVKQKDYPFLASLKNLAFFALCFLVPYIFIRFIDGSGGVVAGKIRFPANVFAFQNLVGFLFMISTTLLFLLDKFAGRSIRLYLLFSSPYILIILFTGILFEIRLWIPMIIIMVIIFTMELSIGNDNKGTLRYKEEDYS